MGRLRISFGFCALICFLGWLDGSVCLFFLGSVLLHEAGHLLAIRLLGTSVRSVSLHAGGAVIETDMLTYSRELAAAIAGPCASIFAWAVFLCVNRDLSFISLLLGLVNLIPVYPMDGGRILRCMLHLLLPAHRAAAVLNIVTVGVCCLLMIAACTFAAIYRAGLWPIFAAMVILWRIGQASMGN